MFQDLKTKKVLTAERSFFHISSSVYTTLCYDIYKAYCGSVLLKTILIELEVGFK